MNFSFIKLLALTMLLQVSSAYALNSVNFSWEPPTTRQNGDILTAEEIKSYTICYVVDGDVQNGDCIVVSSEKNTEVVDLSLEPRIEPYVVSASIYTTDTFNIEGPMSDTVSASILVKPSAGPTPPTNIVFDINCGNCVVE